VRLAPWHIAVCDEVCVGVRRKQFFSEEKNQKTFTLSASDNATSVEAGARLKVSWFFSSEKNCFFHLPSLSDSTQEK
jgi:hypothetical protein